MSLFDEYWKHNLAITEADPVEVELVLSEDDLAWLNEMDITLEGL